MSAASYLNQIAGVIDKIRKDQLDNIHLAGGWMADSIAQGRVVYIFGSGHSVIPALDVFPRYGSFVGLQPILDPRLMWVNILGPGGVRELLWLERQEGYGRVILQSYTLDPRDTLIVFSHGGLNAAPVEMAQEARRRGLRVIGVTSLANRRSRPTHSSGQSLADVSDIVIDNCVLPEDALVTIPHHEEKVAAGSTVAAVAIMMALVAEAGTLLSERNVPLMIFVSPNAQGFPPDHNGTVFERYRQHTLDMQQAPSGLDPRAGKAGQ